MNLEKITQQYIQLFPGEDTWDTSQRQTPSKIYSLVKPERFEDAKLMVFNEKLSAEIGLGSILSQRDEDFLNAQTGDLNTSTYSTMYAGHQFGNWVGQLGDGRAIFAGEISNECGKITELQWKGAGATPYSRYADGRAVLRSTIREFLMSEAMHHLGIPTTRALSLSLTGEDVVRDVMYNANPKYESGALMMRTAESFLRFGHFEAVFAAQDFQLLKQLADFTIFNYFPQIHTTGKQKYIDWFKEISCKTADLMVEWYRVGFVHGVMNTDNMSVLGFTIDYGPYSMLDEYDLNFTSNTTDLPNKRYAFGKQAQIAQWNLWQLSNAIFPLIEDAELLQNILEEFGNYFWLKYDEMLTKKFGFDRLMENDEHFFNNWQSLMSDLKLDYTLFFQLLEDTRSINQEKLQEISYKSIEKEDFSKFENFIKKYLERKSENFISEEESLEIMRKTNPKFILRNYLLYECIEDFNDANYHKFYKLWEACKQPYQNIFSELNLKRPEKYREVIGCSMLSCSS